MEISGITPSAPFSFLLPDTEDSSSTPAAVQDTVHISAPSLLRDDEVEDVLGDTLSMIAGDNAGALAAHGGLSESRVFALLGL
ncbi:hypothetical protein [Desulfovibrio sp. ZJ369]|uniref:hypothetical protein n=1 Tax=Desulfovibrio sp. ZJ369 TaxID=2709793 RepID=UPI0013EB08FC|nr:hypothetical protein [Desulfovibrio sp. ZJ369]